MRAVPVPRPAANAPHLAEVVFRPQLHPMIQAAGGAAPTNCAGFSKTLPHVGLVVDGARHVGSIDQSNHSLTDLAQSSCTYTDGAGTNCDTACNVTVSTAAMSDIGSVTGFCHKTSKQQKNDTINGVGTGADCGGGTGGGVKECLTCLCSVAVSVSSNGATVSVSSDGFFTADDGLGLRCATQANPQATPTPTPVAGGIPPDPCLNSATVPGPTGAFGTTPPGGRAPDCSPIIIDLTGDGFFLTSAANGVKFDIANTGVPIQIAWTANANNAFLVLDRNGNGVINSGAELFGNFTPQPASPHPNGFLALAQYDSNGDGVIDAKDPIYSQLRLWVDANHDGISQPGELHTLPEMGVFSISLNYSLSMQTDEFGNVFRYRARVNQGLNGKSEVGRQVYDVFFVTK